MNLHDYLRVLRQGVWVLVVLTLLGAGAGGAFAAISTPTFQVTSTVYISLVGSGTTSDLQQGNVFATQKAATYAQLATSDPVLEAAVDELGDGTEVGDLRAAVSASVRGSTSIIDIYATGDNGTRVAAWANSVASALGERIGDLDAPSIVDPTTGLATVYPVSVELIDPAEISTTAVTPQPRYNILVGAVIGFALGVAILITRFALDTRVRAVGNLPRSRKFTSVTSIPGASGRARQGQEGGRTEAFRTLRANLQFSHQTGKFIAVAPVDSSADSMEVSMQLARVFGEIGARVLVIDLDLRPMSKPRLSRRGEGEEGQREKGIADILRGEMLYSEAIVETEFANVSMLPKGNVDEASSQLLSTTRMRTVLDRVEGQHSYVILACPPLVERSESAVVAALADTSIVVIEAGATTRQSFLFSLELLSGVHVDDVSVVLENVRENDLSARTRPVTAAS
jgi:polysaccharide biosynthesis transport protein